ncbi:hypothetical protein [Streptomyces asiaticus]|uniref:hypothetical protein n=1 Tax=Streptomyces asiaticus TaxID=114695 RepID=UPI0037F60DE6
MIAVLDPLLSEATSFTTYNSGIDRHGKGFAYNVHHLPDGTPNPEMVDLAVSERRAGAGVVYSAGLSLQTLRPGGIPGASVRGLP